MLGNNILNENLSACTGDSRQVGPGFYLVGNDGIKSAVHSLHAVYLDNAGTCALNICTHGVQEVCKVNDMRFFSSVFYNGFALGLYGSKHNIHGCANRHNVEINIGTLKIAFGSIGNYHTVHNVHISTHGLESLDVLVNGTHAKITAAGHCAAGVTKATKHCADEVIGCSDGAHHFAGAFPAAYAAAINIHSVLVNSTDIGTHCFKDIQKERYVANLGYIFNSANAVNQQGCRYNGNGRVLCAADFNFAIQRFSAANDILSHFSTSLRIIRHYRI